MKYYRNVKFISLDYRGVARKGVRGARAPAPRNLADQLTLLEPGWADFVPHTTVSPRDSKSYS